MLHLYQSDAAFKEKYLHSKGFLYSALRHVKSSAVHRSFRGSTAENFRVDTDRLYLENMKRVRDDVAWFINKFDHKYADEPWKNAKDSLTRAMTKDNSIL